MKVYGSQSMNSSLVVFTDHADHQKTVSDFWHYTLESSQDYTFILVDNTCVDVFYTHGSDNDKFVIAMLHNPIWRPGQLDIMVLTEHEYLSWLSSISDMIDYD